MKKHILSAVSFFFLCLFCSPFLSAQNRVPHTNFHAGLHSGSWTLQREQILDWESKDKYRSCNDPFCQRCAKHLADYGHEYQYIGGQRQRQMWYPGTAGTIAHVTQRGYDQHGRPYTHRGAPAAVMSWEYQRVLNHAIWEQTEARNAVAAMEAAEDRVQALTDLLGVAQKLLANSEAQWKPFEQSGHCVACQHPAGSPCAPVAEAEEQKTLLKKHGKRYRVVCCNPSCEYCQACRQYQKDLAYTCSVEQELALATQDLQCKTLIADEKVRIALLSKDDADRATRFKRIQHKPPKYKEVLAAKETAEARTKAQTPKLVEEEKPIEETEDITELPAR